jgi:hypothetical protein
MILLPATPSAVGCQRALLRGGPAQQGLDAQFQVGFGKYGLDGAAGQLGSCGQDVAVDLAELGDQCLVDGDPGVLGGGQAGAGLPPVGLVLEQVQVGGLVAVNPDDAGHGGVVQPASHSPRAW